jgi:predicted component of type VI protein secretion system
MEENKLNASTPAQDELAYQWLDENTRLIGGLNPDQNPEQYSSTLLKMVFEGQKQLAKASSGDPVLVCYLNLLLAEAQVNLALVEKDANTRKMFVTQGYEYGQQAVAILEEQGISGLACRALPRALIILTGAYKAAADDQHPAVEASLKKAADLLDEFRIQQSYERHKAVDNLLEGRVFALSTAEITDPTDRRQMLEKAAASLRRAVGYSGLAFDDELTHQAEETLAEIEKSLSSASLPVPVFPMTGTPAEPEAFASAPAALIEEATLLKPTPWMMAIESGPLKGQRFPLSERLRIGRVVENDLALNDEQVSRKHAVIERAGEGYQISDLGSVNGTLVNGSPIGMPTELKPGDVVQIGETRLAVLGPAGTAPLPEDEPTLKKPAPAPAGASSKVREAAHPSQVTPAPAMAPPGTRLCPHCGAPLKSTSKFCGSCGKLVAAPLQPSLAAPATLQPVRVCPNCGEPARPGVMFCKKCGQKL